MNERKMEKKTQKIGRSEKKKKRKMCFFKPIQRRPTLKCIRHMTVEASGTYVDLGRHGPTQRAEIFTKPVITFLLCAAHFAGARHFLRVEAMVTRNVD